MPIGTDNKRVVYYYDEEVGNFYYGQNHPMKPHRIRMTHSLIVNYGLFKKMEIYRPYRLEERDMTLFHADDYIHFIKSVTVEDKDSWGTDLEKFNIDVDCPIFDGLFRFCQISTGASVGGAYKLNHGLADIAINWSGGLHHAKKAEASGFCYTNDIVLGILELLKYYERVLYIDIDIHHGDGVEEAFYTTNRVMTVSFHKYGDFFPGTGAIEDRGVASGKNYSINVPLDEGIDDDSYHYVFKPLMDKVIAHYQPGVIVMQLGADSLAGDRLGCFNMTVRGHGECLEYIRSFNKPLLVLGGGGYTLRNVARCWAHETAISCGIELEDKIPYHEYYEYFAPDYRLSTIPTNMVNVNRRSSLDKIMSTVGDYLRELPHAPSVQMHERPKELALDPTIGVCVSQELEKLRQDIESDNKKDERLPEFLLDKMRIPDNEFYSDDKDQDWPMRDVGNNNGLNNSIAKDEDGKSKEKEKENLIEEKEKEHGKEKENIEERERENGNGDQKQKEEEKIKEDEKDKIEKGEK